MPVRRHVQNIFLILEDTVFNLLANCQQALWAFLCHENSNIFFIISTKAYSVYITHNSSIELNWPGALSLLTQHMVSLFQITKTTLLWEQKYRGALCSPSIVTSLKANAKSDPTFPGS